eukprot:gene1665-2769_t
MAEKSCDFTQCGDKQGVLYWMGTRKGVAEWQNPGTSGEVEVCVSSITVGQPPMFSDTTFTTQCLSTKNEMNSWMGVDLKTAQCCPTIYTLAPKAQAKDGFL